MAEQKKGLRKVNLILIVTVLLLVAIVVLTTKKPVSEKKEMEKKEIVKIGFLGDFSNDKARSENALAAVKIGLEDINKIYDKRYELAVYDADRHDRASVENTFKSASSDNVIAIINTVRSSSDPSSQEKLPAIFVGGIKNESKTRQEFYWSIGLFTINSHYFNSNIAQQKSKYNITKAALLVDNERIIPDSVIGNIESLKQMQTSSYAFDKEKLSSLVKEIKQNDPDAIILLTSSQNGIEFLKAANENGLQDKLFLAFLPPTKPLLLEYEKLPKRVIVPASAISILANTTPPDDDFENFVNRFTSLTGNAVRDLELNAYDAVSLTAHAVSKAAITNKPETMKEDREKLMKEIWATGNFKSLRGTLTPDGKTGYFERKYIRTLYIENGRFKSAKGVTI